MKLSKNQIMRGILFLFLLFFGSVFILPTAAEEPTSEQFPDGCTTITVGRLASADRSVITSHTCDSHRTRSSVFITPQNNHAPGTMTDVHKREDDDSTPMPRYERVRVGEIPQVEETYGFINTAYPCMNEHQLAVGESTFGGREELHSENGLIDCPELCRILMERCMTARDAIKLAGELIAKYGWNDEGECLTFADTKEVWHIEIVGPGKGQRGGVWAAQRVPDDHVSVNANASRIRQIDLSKPDYFMASENVFSVAQENGWWDPNSGKPFEFCYVYNPEGRTSFASRRREWRVLDLVAPSLKLHANDENYPFSVKPDKAVTMELLMTIFRDWFEGTEFDMTKNITVTDEDGKTGKSPLANPFMPYDMNPLFNINGGWGWRGERPIARWYCMYVIITQSRDWLPDPIGGLVWYGLDNPATTAYVPLYCGITDLPESYKTCGRITGFSLDCAWWIFNRVGTLAAQRWGDMRKDVRAIWEPFQKQTLAKQEAVEAEALTLHNVAPEQAGEFLTEYTGGLCKKILKAYLDLGDLLWTKYDEKW
jgi:dipeptidase